MIEIRKAKIDDCIDIQDVASVAFTDTYREILSPEQLVYMMEWMYSTESLHRQMLEEQHTYYIMYREGVPVGYVSVQPHGENVFHLQKIYLLPSCQGLGYGKLLFEQAKAAVKEMHPNPCVMELNVNRNNKAVDFYKKMGMHIDRQGDFPIGNGFYMNDYIMAMDL